MSNGSPSSWQTGPGTVLSTGTPGIETVGSKGWVGYMSLLNSWNPLKPRIVPTALMVSRAMVRSMSLRSNPRPKANPFAVTRLSSGVQGITDLITTPGLINVDFADVKAVMTDAGSAVMGIGSSTGENRASQAADKAISSPLLETSMEGARGVLLSISGPEDMTLHEISTAASIIADHCDSDANIIFGAVVDDSLGSEMKVTVIAAGFDRDRRAVTRSTYTEFSARTPEPEGDDDLDIPGFVSG